MTSRVDPAEVYAIALEEARNHPLVGHRFADVGTVTPELLAQMAVATMRQESSFQKSPVRDGRLYPLPTTPRGERSFGLMQFKPEDRAYGFTGDPSEMNDIRASVRGFYNVANKFKDRGSLQGALSPYFGSWRRPREVADDIKWVRNQDWTATVTPAQTDVSAQPASYTPGLMQSSQMTLGANDLTQALPPPPPATNDIAPQNRGPRGDYGPPMVRGATVINAAPQEPVQRNIPTPAMSPFRNAPRPVAPIQSLGKPYANSVMPRQEITPGEMVQMQFGNNLFKFW